MRFRSVGWLVAAVSVVAGCGCGGSGSNNNQLPPTPPAVTSVSPGNAATLVAVNSAVTATFNESMNATTLTTATFTLTPQGGAAITASVIYNSANMTATLTPTSPLAYSTNYTATITTGVQASNGAALAQSNTWTFTTAAAPPPAPTVASVAPASGATGVSIGATLTATFSVAMNPSTVTNSTFTLTGPGNTAVQGNITSGTTTFAFIPAGNLGYNTQYTATITTGAQSAAGVALAQNYSWTFTTVAAPAPTVATTVPASGATNVNVSNALTATFSLPMNSNTLTASTFTLATTSGNTPVPGTITYNSGTSSATLTPSAALAHNTSYTATITTGAQSSAVSV